MKVPENLLYAKSHEWVRQDGETAVIGVTDYAQHELGDVVFLELPAPGTAVKAGESFGSVESVKSVSELIAPLSGEVVEANPSAVKAPESLNKDPYGAAWMIRIKPSQPDELKQLMSAEQYKAHTGEDS
jgi:glycine cleavage system H protein